MHSPITSGIFSFVQPRLFVNLARTVTTSNARVVVIRERDLVDLITDLEPRITTRRDRRQFTADPVGRCRYDESSKEVDVVDVL